MAVNPNDQVIPDNTGKSGKGTRNVIESVKVPDNPSIKNPDPPKVKLRDKDSRQYGLTDANGLVSKFKDQLSVSTTEVPALGGGIQQLISFIKKLDGQNTSGATKPALDILDQILKSGMNNPLSSVPGALGGGLMGQLQSFITQLLQQNKNQNNSPPPPPPTCPNNMIWSANLQMCVFKSNTAAFVVSN